MVKQHNAPIRILIANTLISGGRKKPVASSASGNNTAAFSDGRNCSLSQVFSPLIFARFLESILHSHAHPHTGSIRKIQNNAPEVESHLLGRTPQTMKAMIKSAYKTRDTVWTRICLFSLSDKSFIEIKFSFMGNPYLSSLF